MKQDARTNQTKPTNNQIKPKQTHQKKKKNQIK